MIKSEVVAKYQDATKGALERLDAAQATRT